MLVTVVLPTFKRPDLATHAIEQILKQTHVGEVEVLVVDSTPELPPLVYTPRDGYTVRQIHAPGLVCGAARRLGQEESRGDVIVHWNDDDWYCQDRIDRQLASLTSSGKGCVCTGDFFCFEPATQRAWRKTYKQWATVGTFAETREHAMLRPIPDLEDGGYGQAYGKEFWASGAINTMDPGLWILMIHGGNSERKGFTELPTHAGQVFAMLGDDMAFWTLRSGMRSLDTWGERGTPHQAMMAKRKAELEPFERLPGEEVGTVSMGPIAKSGAQAMPAPMMFKPMAGPLKQQYGGTMGPGEEFGTVSMPAGAMQTNFPKPVPSTHAAVMVPMDNGDGAVRGLSAPLAVQGQHMPPGGLATTTQAHAAVMGPTSDVGLMRGLAAPLTKQHVVMMASTISHPRTGIANGGNLANGQAALGARDTRQLLSRRFSAERLATPPREVSDRPKILIITLHPTLARNEAALYHSLGWSVYTPWHAAGELGLFPEGHPCRTEVPKLSPATIEAVRRIDVQYGATEHVPDIAQALCEFDAIVVTAIPNWLTNYCQPALAAGRKVFFRVYGHEYIANDTDAYLAISEKATLVAAHASEIAPDGLWNSWRGRKVSALPVVPMGTGVEPHNGGFALGVGNGIKDSHLDGVMQGNRVPWRTVDELSGIRISDRELEDLYAVALVSVDSLAFLASSHAHRYVIRYSSLEAMARGCPNLTLAGRGLHALMVADGFTHDYSYTWVTSSDAADLARWYLARPEEAKRLGEKQRAWLQKRLTMASDTWKSLLA